MSSATAVRDNPAHNVELGRLPEAPHTATLQADVVVVGSGAGGAVVAATLAEAGRDVLVLEEGPMVRTEDIRRWSMAERLVRLYRDSGLSAAAGLPPVALPMGRCVGGTTTVNSGTCFPTPDAVLDAWARRGLHALSPHAFAPLLREVEEVIGVRQIGRDIMGGNARMAEVGARNAGLHGALLHRNERGCIGSGQCPMGCPQGAKQDMRMTFLPRAVQSGARILAGVRVRSVDHDGGTVRGVTAGRVDVSGTPLRGSRLTVRAPMVVLSAGAVYTPALLLRAGLGGAHVGRHLAVHPVTEAAGFVAERVEGWRGVQQSYGIHPEPGVTIEATFPPGGTALRYLPLNGPALKELMSRWAHAVLLGVMVVDGGNGRVRLAPGGNTPLVTYRLGEAEAGRLVRGLAHTARVLRAAGAREVYTPLRGLPVLDANTDLSVIERAHARDLALAAFHPLGTVRMAAREDDGPVDPQGRVRGTRGLVVADASLLPSAPGVNPQVTIMAMALHVARELAQATARRATA